MAVALEKLLKYCRDHQYRHTIKYSHATRQLRLRLPDVLRREMPNVEY